MKNRMLWIVVMALPLTSNVIGSDKSGWFGDAGRNTGKEIRAGINEGADKFDATVKNAIILFGEQVIQRGIKSASDEAKTVLLVAGGTIVGVGVTCYGASLAHQYASNEIERIRVERMIEMLERQRKIREGIIEQPKSNSYFNMSNGLAGLALASIPLTGGLSLPFTAAASGGSSVLIGWLGMPIVAKSSLFGAMALPKVGALTFGASLIPACVKPIDLEQYDLEKYKVIKYNQ